MDELPENYADSEDVLFNLSSDDYSLTSDDDDDDIPYELMYMICKKKLKLADYIDVDKIHYNDHFKRRGIDYVISKMPAGSGDHIPGWQQVLETFASNISDSPLDEFIKISTNNIYDGEDTNISEFKNSQCVH